MITTMASDTYDINILSRSGMIWIIDPCYKLVLMGIMWYICGEGAAQAVPLPGSRRREDSGFTLSPCMLEIYLGRCSPADVGLPDLEGN